MGAKCVSTTTSSTGITARHAGRAWRAASTSITSSTTTQQTGHESYGHCAIEVLVVPGKAHKQKGTNMDVSCTGS